MKLMMDKYMKQNCKRSWTEALPTILDANNNKIKHSATKFIPSKNKKTTQQLGKYDEKK
jgi:hypothetical protein